MIANAAAEENAQNLRTNCNVKRAMIFMKAKSDAEESVLFLLFEGTETGGGPGGGLSDGDSINNAVSASPFAIFEFISKVVECGFIFIQ